MGTTLTGTTPASTYDSLIKVTDNGPIGATAKYLSDGLGNDSKLALGTSGVGIGTTSPVTIFTAEDTNANIGVFNVIGTSPNYIFDVRDDGTSVFRVAGTGNVGIGTSSPTEKLHIVGGSVKSSNSGETFSTTLANDGVYAAGTDLYLLAPASKFVSIYAGNTERMRITSAGYVGIGTSSPSATLNIKSISSNNSNSLADVLTNSEFRLQYRADDISSLYIGGLGSERGYLQGVNSTASSGADISLNPYGGNVGIGTGSPSMALELVKNSTVGLGGNVYYSARFLQDKTNFRGVFLAYDTSGQTAVIGAESAGAASELAFYTYSGSAWGERVTVTSNGLTFNGDKAAANALDDYEEGTFTPTYAGGLTGVTYSTRYGSYTKIGNRVMFDLRIQASSVSGTSGSLVIGGLPFATNGAIISNATIGYFGVYTTDIVYCLIDTNAVDAVLFYQKDTTPLLGSELTNNTSAIHLSGVYFV